MISASENITSSWCEVTDSNRRPSACKADALPAELTSHKRIDEVRLQARQYCQTEVHLVHNSPNPHLFCNKLWKRKEHNFRGFKYLFLPDGTISGVISVTSTYFVDLCDLTLSSIQQDRNVYKPTDANPLLRRWWLGLVTIQPMWIFSPLLIRLSYQAI